MKKSVVTILSLVLIGVMVLSACTPAPAAPAAPEVEEPVAPAAEKSKRGTFPPGVTPEWVPEFAYKSEHRAKEWEVKFK